MSIAEIEGVLVNANKAPMAKHPVLICVVLFALIFGLCAALAVIAHFGFGPSGWITKHKLLSAVLGALLLITAYGVRRLRSLAKIEQDWYPSDDI